MSISQYFVIAEERPYRPLVDQVTAFTVELDVAFGRPPGNLADPVRMTMSVHVAFVDETWGPKISRVEGYVPSTAAHRAQAVRGHFSYDAHPAGERIGVLQVTNDD